MSRKTIEVQLAFASRVEAVLQAGQALADASDWPGDLQREWERAVANLRGGGILYSGTIGLTGEAEVIIDPDVVERAIEEGTDD